MTHKTTINTEPQNRTDTLNPKQCLLDRYIKQNPIFRGASNDEIQHLRGASKGIIAELPKCGYNPNHLTKEGNV